MNTVVVHSRQGGEPILVRNVGSLADIAKLIARHSKQGHLITVRPALTERQRPFVKDLVERYSRG